MRAIFPDMIMLGVVCTSSGKNQNRQEISRVKKCQETFFEKRAADEKKGSQITVACTKKERCALYFLTLGQLRTDTVYRILPINNSDKLFTKCFQK